jgi:hypothetical protein
MLSRKVSRGSDVSAVVRSPGTTSANRTPASAMAAAISTKVARHPTVAADQASGAVAKMVPSVPRPSWTPVKSPKRDGGKRRA